jgi:ArsR family transcriptional regulator
MDEVMAGYTGTAGFLKALAHPARLQIAGILRHGEACVCHLEAYLGYRQPYLSQQITVLRRAGLVAVRREGTYTFYRLADPRVADLLDVLMAKEATRITSPSPRHAGCSCPHCVPIPETST